MSYTYACSEALNLQMKAIRLAIFDIDGVMTNGQLFFTDSGEEMKAFHVHDGLGLKWLMTHGVDVAVITARKPQLVAHRVEGLGIKHYYCGVSDKKTAYQDLKHKLHLADEHIAYTGDDLIDLGIMKQCGLAVAVANAHSQVKQVSHLTLKRSGGEGAVREVSELILQAQGQLEGIFSSY